MRKDVLGLMMMWIGAGTLLGAVQSAVGSRALGNPVEGWFLLELVVAGILGITAFVVGIVLLVQALQAPPAVSRAIAPAPAMGERPSWSAIAFLVVILALAALYLGLVFITSGITGVLLQFVFFVPIGIVVLLLGRWWSKRLGWSSVNPGPPN